ncbi:hypothetical protein Fbal_3173 [Ferrimonas balearica DSM 9799]|uniref:Lipoprotein n=1 Tax=Ferrimonas balearica (strain DSM 9799 / CCM 4581 / KCTC 23876 / PAT) TaxID=550540 RepID=E1SV72_FERBD|nr:hypothetical protein [Ferrimonas balearica]ADN77372.1 hypothetical protein Fbal_3173 [Ferrimonas balearica DSM 9799]MBY5980474.1 hypothetical protein [Ferrimonas balearica]MBY6017871.1 hypothetical protein [Halomonas denitrificans]MBY6094225.1 hypothetical protein [Ferrimonas balearica]
MFSPLKVLLSASLALTLMACSSTPETDVAAADVEAEEDKGVICEKVKVTGSRLPVRKCTTAEQRRMEMNQNAHILDSSLGTVVRQSN